MGENQKKDKVFKTKIMLPYFINNPEQPDWEYMENFVKKLWYKNLDTRNKSIELSNFSKWRKFSFDEVFEEIYKGTPQKSELTQSCSYYENNKVLYVTRTDLNNGTTGYVLKDNEFDVETGNAIIIGDTTATCFYQENEFITGDHIVILRTNNLNKYNALFITTMIKKEKYRFCYGRPLKITIIKKSKIFLPQTKEGKIDWEYMENFVKKIPYGDKI